MIGSLKDVEALELCRSERLVSSEAELNGNEHFPAAVSSLHWSSSRTFPICWSILPTNQRRIRLQMGAKES